MGLKDIFRRDEKYLGSSKELPELASDQVSDIDSSLMSASDPVDAHKNSSVNNSSEYSSNPAMNPAMG